MQVNPGVPERALLIVGHSHLTSLVRGWRFHPERFPGLRVSFVNLRADRFLAASSPTGVPGRRAVSKSTVDAIDPSKVKPELDELAKAVDQVLYVINGNQHNIVALSDRGDADVTTLARQLDRSVHRRYAQWLAFLQPHFRSMASVLFPPPPIESEAWIRANPGPFSEVLGDCPLMAAADRRALWEAQCRATRSVASMFGVPVIELPSTVFSASGYLAEDCRLDGDSAHTNATYGLRVLEAVVSGRQRAEDSARSVGKSGTSGVDNVEQRSHPYTDLPDSAFWGRVISSRTAVDVDPITNVPFRISFSDRVATAGSCFAQHISRRLEADGFNFLAVEDANQAESAQRPYEFSARYGNIYTARQLLQLFDRAFGHFKPIETVWQRADGRYCDPFRPRITENGYVTEDAVHEDTNRHLEAVCKMFRELDVFVFTLGLTECFASKFDGAVYPLAPGVAAGTYAEDRYEFLNFGVSEVAGDLKLFLTKLRTINPSARLILTVSPVPLVATRSGHHVLVATTYSKAVLRVAAHEVASTCEGVLYFPSYEIITGAHASGTYFSDDRRSVTPSGVDHVMRVFMGRIAETGSSLDADPSGLRGASNAAAVRAEALMEVVCDEELLGLASR